MARIRIFVVLALALVAGGTFAFGTYQYIQAAPARRRPRRRQDGGGARRRLRPRPRRRAARARTCAPSSGRPTRCRRAPSTNPDELVGRGLIQPVAQNEPFLPAKLASKEAGAGLPPIIPEGYRALSVRVNDVVGVAGYVLPGTRVDVVATVNPTQRPEDVPSKVILTNVQVLTAGTKIERDEADGKPIAVSVVTLLVDPGAGRAPDAGEHRGQDSARAAQPDRQDRAGHRRHPARRADGRRLRPASACRCGVGAVRRPAPRAAPAPSPRPAADRRDHPRRQARAGSREPGVVMTNADDAPGCTTDPRVGRRQPHLHRRGLRRRHRARAGAAGRRPRRQPP